jgi:hypothetical protein
VADPAYMAEDSGRMWHGRVTILADNSTLYSSHVRLRQGWKWEDVGRLFHSSYENALEAAKRFVENAGGPEHADLVGER